MKNSTASSQDMKFTQEFECEHDGRFLAEVPELAGVLAYGKTADEATSKAVSLAVCVLAEQFDHAGAVENNRHSIKH